MLIWPSTTGMAKAGATTEDLETQTLWISVTLTTKDRHTSNLRSLPMEHSEVTACTTPVSSGTSFGRDEDDVQFNDDEEVQSLIEGESEALAAVSQANQTLTQARQAV